MNFRPHRQWISGCLSVLLVLTFLTPAVACDMDAGDGDPVRIELDAAKTDCHGSENDPEPAPDQPCTQCLSGCMSHAGVTLATFSQPTESTLSLAFLGLEQAALPGGYPERLFRPPAPVPTI